MGRVGRERGGCGGGDEKGTVWTFRFGVLGQAALESYG